MDFNDIMSLIGSAEIKRKVDVWPLLFELAPKYIDKMLETVVQFNQTLSLLNNTMRHDYRELEARAFYLGSQVIFYYYAIHRLLGIDVSGEDSSKKDNNSIKSKFDTYRELFESKDHEQLFLFISNLVDELFENMKSNGYLQFVKVVKQQDFLFDKRNKIGKDDI